jgi:hypothetical protein
MGAGPSLLSGPSISLHTRGPRLLSSARCHACKWAPLAIDSAPRARDVLLADWWAQTAQDRQQPLGWSAGAAWADLLELREIRVTSTGTDPFRSAGEGEELARVVVVPSPSGVVEPYPLRCGSPPLKLRSTASAPGVDC